MEQNEASRKLFATAFNFTKDDLTINREEFLSEKQKQSLMKHYFQSSAFRNGLILGIPFFFLGLVLFTGFYEINIFMKIVISLLGLWFILKTINSYLAIRRDIETGEVLVRREGVRILKRSTRTVWRTNTYYLIYELFWLKQLEILTF